MATAPMSFIGGSSLTGHLLIIAKKTTTPLVEEDRLHFAPPVPNPLNTFFDNLLPVPHTIDFRDSPDGTALGTLLTTFLYDVKNRRAISEKRFYRVGGTGAHDPAPGTADIIDPYLDGKTIGGVFKEGFRYLIPEEEWTDYSGGGVSMLSGYLFAEGEVVSVDINYMDDVPNAADLADIPGYKLVTENTTFDATFRNCEIEVIGDGTRVTLTLEVITGIPEGTGYHITSFGGNQYQTKIVTQSGNLILFGNTNFTQIVLGQNEFVKLRKRGTQYRVIECSAGLSMVGERFTATTINHSNALPEDDRIVSGDDYPRLYQWLQLYMPSSHKISTTDALLAGFSRPTDKPGAFIITTDSNRFRMPNTQALVDKGLKDFDTYGADTARLWDYPGGLQNDQVGPHYHDTAVQNKDAPGSSINPDFNRGKQKPARRWNATNGVDTNQTSSTDINTINNGAYPTENIVKNIGVINFRRT